MVTARCLVIFRTVRSIRQIRELTCPESVTSVVFFKLVVRSIGLISVYVRMDSSDQACWEITLLQTAYVRQNV